MVKVISSITPNFAWHIKSNAPIHPEDSSFIAAFNPPVYHNDRECYLWAFDKKLPSGAWLENIRFSNDMNSAQAFVFYQEAAQ